MPTSSEVNPSDSRVFSIGLLDGTKTEKSLCYSPSNNSPSNWSFRTRFTIRPAPLVSEEHPAMLGEFPPICPRQVINPLEVALNTAHDRLGRRPVFSIRAAACRYLIPSDSLAVDSGQRSLSFSCVRRDLRHSIPTALSRSTPCESGRRSKDCRTTLSWRLPKPPTVISGAGPKKG